MHPPSADVSSTHSVMVTESKVTAPQHKKATVQWMSMNCEKKTTNKLVC